MSCILRTRVFGPQWKGFLNLSMSLSFNILPHRVSIKMFLRASLVLKLCDWTWEEKTSSELQKIPFLSRNTSVFECQDSYRSCTVEMRMALSDSSVAECSLVYAHSPPLPCHHPPNPPGTAVRKCVCIFTSLTTFQD